MQSTLIHAMTMVSSVRIHAKMLMRRKSLITILTIFNDIFWALETAFGSTRKKKGAKIRGLGCEHAQCGANQAR